MQSPIKTPDMLDAATFAKIYNEGNFYRQERPSNYTAVYNMTDTVGNKEKLAIGTVL